MRQIQPDGRADGTGDVVALRPSGADLRPLNGAVLLEATMIHLVAQYSVAPSGRTIRKTRIKP